MGVKWKKTEEKNEFCYFLGCLRRSIEYNIQYFNSNSCFWLFVDVSTPIPKKSYLSKMTFFALFFDIITPSCHKEDFWLYKNIRQKGSISNFSYWVRNKFKNNEIVISVAPESTIFPLVSLSLSILQLISICR